MDGVKHEFICILCLKRFAKSAQTEEHIFPFAIGGTLVLYDLCKPCNDMLGNTVDVGLVEHQSMLFHRRNFDLLGRSRREVTPLTGRALEDPRRTVSARKEGGSRFEPLYDKTAAGLEIRVHPDDASDLPKLIARAQKSKRAGMVVGTVDTTPYTPVYDLTLWSKSWVRGLIKISYELAYRALGPGYLDDPVAAQHRALLTAKSDGTDEIEASRLFRWIAGPALYFRHPMSKPYPSLLMGATFRSQSVGTFSYLRIFDTFEAVVLVSERSDWPLPLDGIADITDVVARSTRRTTFFEIAMECEAGRLQSGT